MGKWTTEIIKPLRKLFTELNKKENKEIPEKARLFYVDKGVVCGIMPKKENFQKLMEGSFQRPSKDVNIPKPDYVIAQSDVGRKSTGKYSCEYLRECKN